MGFLKKTTLGKKEFALILLGLFLLAAVPLTVTVVQRSEETQRQTRAATPRDKYKQPFSSNSIWNLPIGADAVNSMVPAGLAITSGGTTPGADRNGGGQIVTDSEYIGLNPSDPLKSLNGVQVHVPPTMEHDCSWNGVTGFLQQDNTHVSQGQPLCLSPGGTPSYQYSYPTVDINAGLLNGDDASRKGAHGGSALSSFGGSIRKGELSGAEPIRHALKINLDSTQFISGANSGYRWPASKADSNAYNSGACDYYAGKVTQLKMGAFLALRPDADLSFIRSNYARKIAQALKDYGTYVVDATCWNVFAFSKETGAEFSDGGSFNSDLQRIMTMLQVVDGWNQTKYVEVAQSNGVQGSGGGAPRVCWTTELDGTVYPCGSSGDTTNPTVTLTAPASGATVSGSNVTISATASDNVGVTQVQFFVNNQSVGTDTTSPYSISWNSTTVANGTYPVFARAFDQASNQANSSTVNITVNNPIQPPPPPPPPPGGNLPSPWLDSDIGSAQPAGSASYSPEVFTVNGGGSDIWDISDQFHYVYRDVTGDCVLIARVDSQTNTDPWAKAGIMIRETTANNSKHAMLVVTPSNGVAIQFRQSSGGITNHVGASGNVPLWVRLTRSGSTITAATSTNGSSWVNVGTVPVVMNSSVKVGLAVLSHNTSVLSQVNFSSVSVSASVAKPGDINNDGVVSSGDLAILLSRFGTVDAQSDLNGNGVVDSGDLAFLISRWGN